MSGQVIALGASGGGITTQPDAVLNETWSRGLADLGDRTRVRGVLHAATIKYGSQVKGSDGVNPPTRDTNPAFEPQNSLTWTVTYPTSGTGEPVTAQPPPNPPLPPLTPGQYGDVTVNSQASLTIKSGTYYLRSLKFESGSTITLDQANGPIILYVETGMLALRGLIKTVSGEAPDLLLAYLGTTAFSVETAFNGALIAPNAAATLRAVNGTHTGFFYTKDFQILDAHARVQYRAPLVIVKAANPTGGSCSALIRSLVPAAGQQAAISRYCGVCASPADTDRDRTQDCLDGCPYDPAKTEPGVCDCGISDTDDTDVDGFPNCIDRCPEDANNIAPGQCGCVGSPNLQPNGTACSDTPGPQVNATCNAGVCGNPTTSRPATGCRLVNYRSSAYWLCPPAGGGVGDGNATPRTQTEAHQTCSAKGLTLVRIDSLEENRFIQSLIKQPIWIGANSITTANSWRWSVANNNNGDVFWNGGVTGTRVESRFHHWSEGSPTSAQRCAVMMPSTGRWSVVPCNQARGYICEYRAPVVRGTPVEPPGMPSQPPTSTVPCISTTAAELPDPGPNGERAAEALADLTSHFERADTGNFTGPFVDPAQTGETCPNRLSANGITRGQTPDDVDAGCQFLAAGPPRRNCVVDADCRDLGANALCRSVNDAAACSPELSAC